MRSRRRSALLASALLALTLAVTPGVQAAEPSADDPAATVNALLDTLMAKDFGGVGGFVCAEKRDQVVQRFDLATQLGSFGPGVDIQALFNGITVTTPDRSVTVTATDGATATVAVTGSIVLDVSDDAARVFVQQLLEGLGQEVTDELLDQYTPLLVGQIERTQDLDEEIAMVVEDGVWLVCDDFGGPGVLPSTAPPSGAPASGPPASLPPMDAAALATLMAAIPADLAASCVPDTYWQIPGLGPDPGEIASVDCDPDGSGGNYVTYSLFDSAASMDAFYDEQHVGMSAMGGLDGPGCPTGPGDGAWEHGRRFCYLVFGDDANTRWTHDALAITASALNDDGDWAALEAFFQSAGPVAP